MTNDAHKNEFLLLAMYGGAPLIPADTVAKTWFNLTPQKFLEKCRSGDIRLPIVHMGETQKSKKMIHVQALATYMSEKTDEAQRDFDRAFR